MSFLRHHSLYHVDCDVGDCCADLATASALARAHVHARRAGSDLRLVNVSTELSELLDFVGLRDVLLRRCERQPEEREETLGVEERSEPGNPPV
jgi:hypothetical protein